jgi:hypothetical protein
MQNYRWSLQHFRTLFSLRFIATLSGVISTRLGHFIASISGSTGLICLLTSNGCAMHALDAPPQIQLVANPVS